jgi:hypothetical protein
LSKREQLRSQRRRRSLVWNGILLGGGGAVLVLVAWYFFAIARPGQFPGEQSIPNEGSGHISSRNADGTPTGARPSYLHYPPTSGQHYGDLVAPWGVYTSTSAIPLPSAELNFDVLAVEGVFVHNLEHGGVVFLYNCPSGCPELEQQFVELYANAPADITFNEKKILVLPYDASKMGGSPIIALAWDHQWNIAAFDEAALIRWYQRFVNKGPELVR